MSTPCGSCGTAIPGEEYPVCPKCDTDGAGSPVSYFERCRQHLDWFDGCPACEREKREEKVMARSMRAFAESIDG